jgi:hypothetical protein
MTKSRFISLGAFALVAAASPLAAQSRQVELAFGYTCGDRFMVRNDGTNPVVVEYAIAGSQDKSTLHLNAKQSAEIASAQSGNMELWVAGKVVASEPKGNRPCGAARNGTYSNNGVNVRPIDPDAAVAAQPGDTAYVAPEVVIAGPRPYYDDYYPYGYYPYPYYYGYSPFLYGSIGIRGRGFIGGRGFVGRGGVGRGRGRR